METDRIFPDNWKEIIQSKKVIFYNTSVGSLLQGREKQIEKMKWVFETFHEHREIVLWWRPHPLEFSTIESMIPHLKKKYIELRTWYKESQIGILDESADLHRAIAISDAYYGDWSSVVQLYKATKKPVLFENIYVKSKEDTVFLPVTFCVKDNALWFMQLDSNKLIKMNRTTYEVEKVVCIPHEPSFLDRQYNYHIIDAGDSLVLLLGRSEQIYQYEIKTGSLKVHKPQGAVSSYMFSSEIVIAGNRKLLMLPYGSNRIYEYEYDSGVIAERESGLHGIKAAKCCERIGSKLYMVNRGTNALCCYDLTNDSFTEDRIGANESRYWGIKRAKEYFVLPHIEKRAVTLWNQKTGEVTELAAFPDKYICLDSYAYLDMFEKDGCVYLFPFCANMILKVDVEHQAITQAFTEVFFEPDYDVDSGNMSSEAYLCANRYDNHIYAYATYKKCLQIFDLSNQCIQSIPFPEITNEEQLNLIECILDDETYGCSFCEGERVLICTLENFIANLCRKCEKSDKDNVQKQSIGQDIYNIIMKNQRK